MFAHKASCNIYAKLFQLFLSCCALCNVDMASKIKYSWIKSVLMIFFFVFCHLSSGRFQPYSSLPNHLFYSEEYNVLSPGVSTDIYVFILHSASVPGRKRNIGAARTDNSLHHMDRRMQLSMNQTHCVVIGSAKRKGRRVWWRGTQVSHHRWRNGKQWGRGGWTAWEEGMCNWAASKKRQFMWIREGKQGIT